jgi:hypothetical protein
MRRLAFLGMLAAVAVLVGACDLGGVVIGDIVTGPTVIDEINVPAPAGGETTELTIGMGGGELDLTAGNIDGLVEGTVAYNVAEIKPGVAVEGNQVRIEQGDIEGKRIPIGNWNDVENHWNLTLGSAPMTLTVNAGAARTKLIRLADLRVEQMTLNGGAGEFRLEFSGELRQDMQVAINCGAASVTLVVPEGVPAELTFEGALTNIDLKGEWDKSGDRYFQNGDGAKITILVKMGVGSLNLSNR